MEVLHIPSGGVEINGVAYLASGAGSHPTLVICHGWPGNEKNLDLAQAARRAGWNAVTFNYRGSWGSPGEFHFAQVSEDTSAVIAWLRTPEVATKLGIDPARIAIAGHSMGGWATAQVASKDPTLMGAVLISAADMARLGDMPRAARVQAASGNAETLVTTPEKMADELAGAVKVYRFDNVAQAYVLTTSDHSRHPAPHPGLAELAITGGGYVHVLAANRELSLRTVAGALPDRKALADIAVHDIAAFGAIAEKAKAALASK
mgnify:CR=1 FL=1